MLFTYYTSTVLIWKTERKEMKKAHVLVLIHLFRFSQTAQE